MNSGSLLRTIAACSMPLATSRKRCEIRPDHSVGLENDLCIYRDGCFIHVWLLVDMLYDACVG